MILRHALLLVQGALAALVAVEAVLLGLVLRSELLVLIGLLAGSLALLPIVLAFQLLRGRPRARGIAVAYEVLLLVSGLLNAIVLGNDDLVSQLVTLVLPLALLWMLRRPVPPAPRPEVRQAPLALPVAGELGAVGNPRRHP